MGLDDAVKALTAAINRMPSAIAAQMGSAIPPVPGSNPGSAGGLPLPPNRAAWGQLAGGALGGSMDQFARGVVASSPALHGLQGDITAVRESLAQWRSDLRAALFPTVPAGRFHGAAIAAHAWGHVAGLGIDRLRANPQAVSGVASMMAERLQRTMAAQLGGFGSILARQAMGGGLGSGVARSLLVSGVVSAVQQRIGTGAAGTAGFAPGIGRALEALVKGGPDRWKDMGKHAREAFASFIPAGQTAHGVAGQGAAQLATAALQEAITRSQGMLGSARVQAVLGPQAASALSAHMARAQSYVGGARFQSAVGDYVSQGVQAGMKRGSARIADLFGAGGAASINWAKVGMTVARGALPAFRAGMSVVRFEQRLADYVERINASNRIHAAYSPALAHAYAMQSYGDMSRSYRAAAAIQDSAMDLVRATSRMRESLLPHQTALGNVGNRFAVEAAGAVSVIADTTAPLADLASWLAKNIRVPGTDANKPVATQMEDLVSQGWEAAVGGAMVLKMRTEGKSIEEIKDFVRIFHEDREKARNDALNGPQLPMDTWHHEFAQRAKTGALTPRRRVPPPRRAPGAPGP